MKSRGVLSIDAVATNDLVLAPAHRDLESAREAVKNHRGGFDVWHVEEVCLGDELPQLLIVGLAKPVTIGFEGR
ncbi:hypothetical protein QT22_00630 [Staphylococcus aureus]|nr:hypothetical protein QT22_00630 [Staphylococcus aureus]